MNRGVSIQNANAIWLFLVTFHTTAIIDIECTSYEVRLHFCDFSMTKGEAERVAAKLDNLRLAGTNLEIRQNTERDYYSIDITWEYWNYEK